MPHTMTIGKYRWGLPIVAILVVIFLFWPDESKERASPVSSSKEVQASEALEGRTQVRSRPPSLKDEMVVPGHATVSDDPDAIHGRFRGRVLSSGTGEGVSGAELAFFHEGVAQSTVADETGVFLFSPFALGTYQLATVSADGYFSYAPSFGTSSIELIAREDILVDGLVFYLTPKVDYEARVVDLMGRKVVGAKAVVSSGVESVLSDEEGEYTSGSDGRFVFHARDYSVLQVEHQDVLGSAIVDEAVQISREMTIVLGVMSAARPSPKKGHPNDDEPRLASLHGHVFSQDGSAVPSFNIVVSRPSGIRSLQVKQSSIFDGQGEFSVSGLSAGEYLVSIVSSGYAPRSVVGQATVQGREEMRIRLEAGASLFGQVLSAETKQPLALAKISAESSLGSGTSARPIIVSAITKDDGTFELGGLPAGRRSIVVSAANHNRRIVSALNIPSEGRVGPVTVELSPVEEGQTPKLDLAGIGVMLEPSEIGLMVRAVVREGGAFEAGLAKRDVIIAIDGQSVTDLGWDDSIQLLRGPIGSQVELLVKRGESESTFVLTRRAIRT